LLCVLPPAAAQNQFEASKAAREALQGLLQRKQEAVLKLDLLNQELAMLANFSPEQVGGGAGLGEGRRLFAEAQVQVVLDRKQGCDCGFAFTECVLRCMGVQASGVCGGRCTCFCTAC
jgi:hypothetical protein